MLWFTSGRQSDSTSLLWVSDWICCYMNSSNWKTKIILLLRLEKETLAGCLSLDCHNRILWMGLLKQHLKKISHSLEAANPRSRYQHGKVLCEGCPPGSRSHFHVISIQDGKREKDDVSCVSNLLHEGSALYDNYLPMVPPPNTITVGISTFNIRILGGNTNIQFITQEVLTTCNKGTVHVSQAGESSKM